MEPVPERQRGSRPAGSAPLRKKIRSSDRRARLRAGPAAGSGVAYGSLMLSLTQPIHHRLAMHEIGQDARRKRGKLA
jgi:hypothetical protein